MSDMISHVHHMRKSDQQSPTRPTSSIFYGRLIMFTKLCKGVEINVYNKQIKFANKSDKQAIAYFYSYYLKHGTSDSSFF